MAGAGAVAEIRDKGGAGAENKLFRLSKSDSNTAFRIIKITCPLLATALVFFTIKVSFLLF